MCLQKAVKINNIFFFIFAACSFSLWYFSFQNSNTTGGGGSKNGGNMEESIKIINKLAKEENVRRRIIIDRVCRKYNLGIYKRGDRDAMEGISFKYPPAPQYEIFYYDVKHNISWCPIYKAGSSTWLYNLAILSGYSDFFLKNSKMQLSQLVREKLPQLEYTQARKALRNSMKFLVVRHPFERLLSAYRDKLENVAVRGVDGTRHFYSSYGRKIVEKYRRGGSGTDSRTILRSGQYLRDPQQPQPLGIEPTFKEFITHLINSDLMTADDHWIPYYAYCTPCSLHYDIICKVETMYRDQINVINACKLGHILKPEWRHKISNNSENMDASEVSETAKIYFSQLTKLEAKSLYEKYKLDFELFNYYPQKYYSYCTSLKSLF